MSEASAPGWRYVEQDTGWFMVGWGQPFQVFWIVDGELGFEDEPFVQRLVALLNESCFAPTAEELGKAAEAALTAPQAEPPPSLMNTPCTNCGHLYGQHEIDNTCLVFPDGSLVGSGPACPCLGCEPVLTAPGASDAD